MGFNTVAKVLPKGWKLKFPVVRCLIDAASPHLCDVFTDAVVMESDTPAEVDLVSSWSMFPTLKVASELFPHDSFPPHYDLKGLFLCLGSREVVELTELFCTG